jgi:organic radical activating enzyme
MIYCSSVYNQWHLDVSGREAPCCFYDVSRNNNIDIEKDRADMAAGKWPRRCEYCRVSEFIGAKSPRLDYTQRVRDAGWADGDASQLFTLSLFIGNKCNLHCITCDAKYSTGWIKIAEQFDVDQSPHVGFDTMRLDSMLPRLQNLQELSIMGGEPMYQDDLLKIISYLAQHLDLSRCLLRLTSNGIVMPSPELMAAMSLFRKVDLTLSIDGVGADYEYIRHPAKWADLENNIQAYKNMSHINLRMNDHKFDQCVGSQSHRRMGREKLWHQC